MKIFIDAGHNYSGADTGAYGNGLREQDITYYVAQKLGNMLKNIGIDIEYSRKKLTDNVGTTLKASINNRYRMANDWGVDYFISLHCDSSPNDDAKGSHVCIYSLGGEAEKLAIAVQQKLLALGLNGRSEQIVVRKDLGVLKYTNMPAILIEMGFISNEENAMLLRDKQQELANAIYSGILNFLGIQEVMNVPDEITAVDKALDKIIGKGVDTDKDYWIKACDYDTNLDKLLVKIANIM